MLPPAPWDDREEDATMSPTMEAELDAPPESGEAPGPRPRRHASTLRSGSASLGAVLGTIWFAAACRAPPEPKPSHPDVILISLDTLRADRLNTYGYSRHTTSPDIDALSRDGIVHEAHVAASPWTTPSHMSLFTSLHPSSHGIIDSFGDVMAGLQGEAGFARLADARVTLAEALSAAGYRTAAFTGGLTLSPAIGFDQGFDSYSSSMFKMSDASLDEMLGWLSQASDRPFFLFWHTFEVHAPYLHGELLPPSLAALRTELARHAELAGELTKADTSNDEMRALLQRHDAYDASVCSNLYDGGVAAADRWVGRLLHFLRERDLYQDALVVLTSDHGEEFADHHPDHFYARHGHSVYEELVRVPLVVKLPGLARAGLRIEQVTSAVDVMPTILELAGVGSPPEGMQGRSLTGLWQAPDGDRERAALVEGTAFGDELKSIRAGRDKLVVEVPLELAGDRGRAWLPPELVRARLFDLVEDPVERRDRLAGTPSADALATRSALEALLRSLVREDPAEVERIELSPETRDALEALGYVE